jgi:hypothetical protein
VLDKVRALSVAALVAVAVAVAACGGGGSSPKQAASTVPAFDETKPTAPPIATTTTLFEYRSIPVPDGAPPLPLYSGDPVAMSRAATDFNCWWNQHPDHAEQYATLFWEPTTDGYAKVQAEASEVQAGGWRWTRCIEVVDGVAEEPHSPTRRSAILTTHFSDAHQVDASGKQRPMLSWNEEKIRIVWDLQPDGRWLRAGHTVLEQS